MRYARFIPVAALAFAAACNESSSNPAENSHDGISASVHLKGGGTAKPTFNDGGLTLTESGSLSGLGNGDVFIGLTATANASATCSNPGGGTQPPGQNPAPVTVSGGQAIPASEIKNGNVSFSVTTVAPTSPRPASRSECPNTSWTFTITDLTFKTATMTVEQPQGTGTIVLTVSCTFSPFTADGSVAGGTVSCS